MASRRRRKPLSDNDLLGVLEDAARRGNADAARRLLGRRTRETAAEPKPESRETGPVIDAMTHLELHAGEHRAEELATRFTPAQRERAREAFEAALDAGWS